MKTCVIKNTIYVFCAFIIFILTFHATHGITSTISQEKLINPFHYIDLTKQVEPRTGEFSLSYKIVDVSGISIEDPVFPLQIHYSSHSQNNTFGIGKGWSWNLPFYDVQTETLFLSNGSSYKLQNNRDNILRNYKLKDIKVTKNLHEIIIDYKDGREEVIDAINGNLVQLTNAQGFSVEFFYHANKKLKSIEYKSIYNKEHPKRVEVFYSKNSVAIKHFDGQGHQAETLLSFKSEPYGTLEKIQNPAKQIISFKYSSMFLQKKQHVLLSRITYPTNFTYAIEYVAVGLKTLTPRISAPVVSCVSTIDDQGVKKDHTNPVYYHFSSENTDEYTSTETRMHPSGLIKINRTYNHFHLLLSESTFLNNQLQQRKEYKYLSWQDKDYNGLEFAYDLPSEISVIYYNEKGQTRIEITKNSYDNYGNLLSSINPSGVVKKYKYLDSTHTFNNIPHLIEREITSSVHEKKSTSVEYQYETVQLANGKKYQRAIKVINKLSPSVCDVNLSDCGTIFKTLINIYATTNDNIISLPMYAQTTTHIEGKAKTVNVSYKYEINKQRNSIYKNHNVNENPEKIATEYVIYNANSKKIIKERKLKSPQEVSYHYDKMGRLTKETVSINTSSLQTISYSYSLNSPVKGQSTLLTTMGNGHKTKVIYDSMGRKIEKWSQAESDHNFVKTVSYKYDIASQKAEEILYNIDANGCLYNLRLTYKYDIYNRNILTKRPDGTKVATQYDDLNNTQTRFILSTSKESSAKTVTVFNNAQQPISSKIVLSNNKVLSQSDHYYDGFGQLIETRDVNGISIKYVYNEMGNKVSEIYNNKNRIHYSYDPLFKEKITKKSVISDGQIIYFKYDELNRLFEKSVEGQKNLKTLYIYDPKTSLLSKTINGSGITHYYYENGKKKRIVYPNNKEVFYNYDLQGQLIFEKDLLGKRIYTNYNKITGKKESITYQRGDNDEIVSQKFYYPKFPENNL